LNKLDSEGLPLIVSMRTEGKGVYDDREIETNFITSIYGKENFEKYIANVEDEDKVIYLSKESGQEFERVAKLQLLRYYSNLDLDTIIKEPDCISNPKSRVYVRCILPS
jgi:hypothetical protein